MANKIKEFYNSDLGTIRTIKLRGKIWFLVTDLYKMLGLKRTSNVKQNVKADHLCKIEGVTTKTRTAAGKTATTTSDILLVDEAGVYTLVLRSNKPNAEMIKDWIVEEVLPSIRRHGGYIAGQEHLSEEERKTLIEKIELLEKEVADLNDQIAQKEEEYEDALNLMRDNDAVTRIRTNDGGYVTEEQYNKYYA